MQDLIERLEDKTHAWAMRVMLDAFRSRGLEFTAAWVSAIQRMRAAPNMSAEQVAELDAFKGWLRWSKPWWEWAYEGSAGPPPQLEPPPPELQLHDVVIESAHPAEALGADPTAMAAALVGHVQTNGQGRPRAAEEALSTAADSYVT